MLSNFIKQSQLEITIISRETLKEIPLRVKIIFKSKLVLNNFKKTTKVEIFIILSKFKLVTARVHRPILKDS